MNAWGMGVDRFRLGGAGLVGGGWRNAAAAGWRFCRVEAGGIVGNFFFFACAILAWLGMMAGWRTAA
jgi:hypothetical protein